MKVSDVNFAISTVLSTIGAKDAIVEQTQEPINDITHFDIQRPMVNGEELWFSFRISFLEKSEEFGILTRQDIVENAALSLCPLSRVHEDTFCFWLRLYIERKDSVLDELTRS